MNSNHLWKQCVEWLVTVGVLQPNHRARFANAVVFDLAQTLRDGVVLCNLLNTLQPGIIDEGQINLRPQMSEFMCMQNIRVVIYILRTAFGISQQDLFESEDLFQMTNFEKVLNVLSCVSYLPFAAAKYEPFPQDLRRQTEERKERRLRAPEEEDIYRNLPDLAAERDLADEDDNLYDSVPEEKEEGIYGTLIGIPKAAPTTMSFRDKRGCCIHEIVETETNYVKHLDMMVDEFIEPLRRTGKMSEKDVKIIFINIEQLRPIHKSFLDELLRLQQEGNNAPFTQPFLRHQDDLLIYGEYCSNLVDAQDHLEELTKCDEALRLLIENCQIKSSRNKFKLRELLCVPMQRILKYHLLIKELNKHTPEGHIDKPNFQTALTAMQEISQYVNEVKRDSEELIKINQIETRLSEYDAHIPLRNYGRVRKDGELKVKFYDDNKQATRYAFLFDQALFMTKLKSDTYILKDLVRLDDMKLDEIPNLKSNKWAWAFNLTSPSQITRNFVLYAKTSSEKIKWMEAFKDAFDNISPRALKGKKHNFEMHTYSEPSTCSHCNLLLKGIFFQGYRCTVSNAQCHKNCLVETLRLIESNSLKPQLQRGESNKPPPVPDRGRKKIDQPNQCALTPEPLNYKAHRMYDGKPPPPFQNVNIVTFNIGELIQVLEQVTSEWWKGKSMSNFNQIGYFPASFVSPQSRSRTQRKDNYLASNPAHRDSISLPSPVPMEPNLDGPIEEADWYAGPVDRGEAEKLLWDKPTGTFLVRKKDQGQAISLKYNKDIKHIKIHRAEGMHFVAECKNFRSVQHLVGFYQEHSLSGFFLGLETTLRYAYRDPTMFPGMPAPAHPPISPLSMRNGLPRRADNQRTNSPGSTSREINVDGRKYEVIGMAQAIYDFDPRSQQELSLRAGQVVHIISKAGGSHGWWKGEYNGKIGYFPITFVEEHVV